MSHLARPTTLQIKDDEGLVFANSNVDHSDDSGLEELLGTLRLHHMHTRSIDMISISSKCDKHYI